MNLVGGCLCGVTRLTANETPQFAIRCYCRDCQRVTGTGSAPQVAFPRDAVTLDGPVKTYRGTADSGSALEFLFCGDCGSPLAKTTSRAEALIFVYAGALDDANAVPELRPVFKQARASWDRDG